MPQVFKPSLIIAHTRIAGDTVYLGARDWVRDPADAEILTDEAVADIRLIEASVLTDQVVDVQLSEIGAADIRAKPHAFRAPVPSPRSHREGEKVRI